MPRKSIIAPVLVASLGLGWLACGSGGETLIMPAELALSAPTTIVPNDGTWVEITLTAKEGGGSPGTGYVVMTATHGNFRGFRKTGTVVLENGSGKIEYRCDVALDTNCFGTQLVNGNWNGLYGYTSVELKRGTPSSDAGTSLSPDSGQ